MVLLTQPQRGGTFPAKHLKTGGHLTSVVAISQTSRQDLTPVTSHYGSCNLFYV